MVWSIKTEAGKLSNIKAHNSTDTPRMNVAPVNKMIAWWLANAQKVETQRLYSRWCLVLHGSLQCTLPYKVAFTQYSKVILNWHDRSSKLDLVNYQHILSWLLVNPIGFALSKYLTYEICHQKTKTTPTYRWLADSLLSWSLNTNYSRKIHCDAFQFQTTSTDTSSNLAFGWK